MVCMRWVGEDGAKRKNITVLHCHTGYPTPLVNVNLFAMNNIEKKFRINVGYSDHTLGNETGIAAVALGAKAIEKHITLNKNMSGPDHAASMEPKNFYNYVKLITCGPKTIAQALNVLDLCSYGP